MLQPINEENQYNQRFISVLPVAQPLLEDQINLTILEYLRLLQGQPFDAVEIAADLQLSVPEVRNRLEYLKDFVEHDEFKDVWSYRAVSDGQIIIDPEFKSLVPPLSTDERQQLRQNLIDDGCRDPLVIWNGILIDGHNRFALCTELEITYQTVEIKLRDRRAAIDWIINNQLGRRNLPPEQKKYLQGKKYNDMKTTHGGDRRSSHLEETSKCATSEKSSGNSYHLKSEPEKSSGNSCHQPKTAEKLAKEFRCGEKTLRNNGKFAEHIDTIGDWAGEDLKVAILNGQAKLTNDQVGLLADRAEHDPDRVREAIEAIKEGQKPAFVLSSLRLTDEHHYQVGDLVIIGKNQLARVVVDEGEFGVVVSTWQGVPLQTVLKSQIKPAEQESISVCANLHINQLAALQSRYTDFESAIEDFLLILPIDIEEE